MARRKSEAEKQITKELRRLHAAIRRAQRRGYFFDTDPLEKLTQKAFSYKKPQTIAKHLASISTNDAYKIAYHANAEGDISIFVKGTKYREIERKEAAKKSATTREANKKRNKYGSVNQDWVNRVNNYTSEPADEASTIINNVINDTANEDAQGLDTTDIPHKITQKLRDTPYDSTRTRNFNEWKRITRNKGINHIFDAIYDLGVETVARNLEKHAFEVRELVDRLIYDSYKGEGDVGAKRDLTRLIQILRGGNITDAEVKDLS